MGNHETPKEGVQGRDQKQGEEGGHKETSDDGSGKREVGFAALTQTQGHGEETGDGGDGGHEDGTQTGAGGLEGGREKFLAASSADVGVIDKENAV